MYQGHSLSEQRSQRKAYAFSPVEYALQLTTQIDVLFPKSTFQDADILDPMSLPIRSIAQTEAYGKTGLYSLARKLDLPLVELWVEWLSLLDQVTSTVTHRAFKSGQKTMSIRDYWLYWLRPNSVIEWGDNIRTLVSSVLSAATSSAQCERAFSFLKWKKYDRRSRLSFKRMDALLRLHINGPHPSKFNSLKYAEAWVRSGKYYTDMMGLGRGKSTTSTASASSGNGVSEVVEESVDELGIDEVGDDDPNDLQLPTFNSIAYDDVPPIF